MVKYYWDGQIRQRQVVRVKAVGSERDDKLRESLRDQWDNILDNKLN